MHPTNSRFDDIPILEGVFEIIGLAFIQIFLCIVAAVVGAVCALIVERMAPGPTLRPLRRRVSIKCVLLSFVAVFYLEAGFFAHAFVQEARGKDNFLNGFYHYPLVNGYQLTWFDENPSDWATLDYNGGQRIPRLGTIYEVSVADHLVFLRGEAEPETDIGTPTVTTTQGNEPQDIFRPSPGPKRPVMRYLELDTKTHEVTDHQSMDALVSSAAKRGVALQWMSLDDAYVAATTASSPGWAFVGILGMPIYLAGWLLVREVRRGVRQTSTPPNSFPPV